MDCSQRALKAAGSLTEVLSPFLHKQLQPVCLQIYIPSPLLLSIWPCLANSRKTSEIKVKSLQFPNSKPTDLPSKPTFSSFSSCKGHLSSKANPSSSPLGSLPSCFSKGQASLLLAPFPEVFEHAHHSRFTKTKPPNPIHFSFTYCPFPLTVTISSKILSLAFMCPASFPPLMTPFQPLYSSLDCCHSTPGQSVTTYIFMNPKFVLKPLLLVSLSQLLPGEPVTGLHIMIY